MEGIAEGIENEELDAAAKKERFFAIHNAATDKWWNYTKGWDVKEKRSFYSEEFKPDVLPKGGELVEIPADEAIPF